MKILQTTKGRNVLIAFMLLVCLFIYIFYRPSGTLINIFLNTILPFEWLLSVKEQVRLLLPLNDAIVYSLPGGLWVFCATLLASRLRLNFKSKNIQLAWLPMLFALWLEFWQFFGVVKGRFDMMDILFVLAFGLSVKFLFILHSKPENNFAISNKPSRAFMLVFACIFMAHVF